MRVLLVAFFLLSITVANAQPLIKGVVLDSLTKQPLPFATVQAEGNKTAIAGIDGKFLLALKKGDEALRFSYSGHRSKIIAASALAQKDTVLLATLAATMEEVVIRSPADKIRRIINTAIRNKPSNNPDRFAAYQCNVYYKMVVDIEPYGTYNMDSIRARQDSLRNVRTAKRKGRQHDTSATTTNRSLSYAVPSHLFMTETYSKRQYKKPGQTQEVVLASKFSGLSKTYFANTITDVLPFHVYSDQIPLNGIDFINPLAKGWQSRYRFLLENEIVSEGDTVYILSYTPRQGTSFNSLAGLIYITTAGYAVTHFTGSSNAADSASRFVRFEHVYRNVGGRWFPQELNYDFGIRAVPSPYSQLVWNGRSVIDSVLFDPFPSHKFDKAHPVKFSDSIDLHLNDDWRRFRRDTLTVEERNTYKNMDSLMKATPMESFIVFGTRLATGRLPIGKLDLDVQRVIAANPYEGTRLGLGLYTNNKVSKYWSVGGWWGYGFRDKTAKYGGSFTLFPKGDKDTWLAASYQKNYRLTGEVSLHPELSQNGLQNWLLLQVDEFTEYALTGNLKAGYWEVRPSFSQQEVGPLHYNFQYGGKQVAMFTVQEGTIGFRYAYGEKRVPFFDYYLSQGTPYPVVYASISRGRIFRDEYKAAYTRVLAAATFTKHINRWGADKFRVETGLVQTSNNQPLPRSLLMAGNGYRRDGLNFYSWGGFVTVRPFDFYTDSYVSFLYNHDFDKNFWNLGWSKPYLGLAHNFVYGGLQPASKVANGGVQSYDGGYHESGLLLNRLLKYNLRFADVELNVGAFYHWETRGPWKKNGVIVLGVSSTF
jgi:hypothetical protein